MIVQIYIDYWNFNKFFALFYLKFFYHYFDPQHKNTGG